MLVITASPDLVDVHSDLDGIDQTRTFRNLATGRDRREWSADLADARTAQAAVEAAVTSIASRRADFDRAIEVIRRQDPGATVGLVLWQDVDDSPAAAGFYLPPDLVAWLAGHGGSVSVDQGIQSSHRGKAYDGG